MYNYCLRHGLQKCDSEFGLEEVDQHRGSGLPHEGLELEMLHELELDAVGEQGLQHLGELDVMLKLM